MPDAIVFIDPDTHQKYVKERADLRWDNVNQIVLHDMAQVHHVPTYMSFGALVAMEIRFCHSRTRYQGISAALALSESPDSPSIGPTSCITAIAALFT